jgi:LacI family transcriptional regulator
MRVAFESVKGADRPMNLHVIADLAKVSIATVSRTINGKPRVGAATARRIWRIIEQVGFYPNIHARALVQGRSRVFGLMVSDMFNRCYPEIAQRFAELGVEYGYEILLSPIPQDSPRLEVVARRFIERRIDAVAILSFGCDESLGEIFARRNVPTFVMNADSSRPSLKTVCIDYEHGIREAVQHLAALGHVRIAFVAGPVGLRSATARKTAFQKCMREISLPTNLLFKGDHTLEGGMKAMSAISCLPDRPSAVICSNDMTAVGVLKAAFDLSFDIPRNLSVIGCDDIWLAQFVRPTLTTLRIPQIDIAHAAFTMLLRAIETRTNTSCGEVSNIKPNLVLRDSTALAPKRAIRAVARVGTATTSA